MSNPMNDPVIIDMLSPPEKEAMADAFGRRFRAAMEAQERAERLRMDILLDRHRLREIAYALLDLDGIDTLVPSMHLRPNEVMVASEIVEAFRR